MIVDRGAAVEVITGVLLLTKLLVSAVNVLVTGVLLLTKLLVSAANVLVAGVLLLPLPVELPGGK